MGEFRPTMSISELRTRNEATKATTAKPPKPSTPPPPPAAPKPN